MKELLQDLVSIVLSSSQLVRAMRYYILREWIPQSTPSGFLVL